MGRFTATFIEERAAWSDSVIDSFKKIREFKLALKKAGLAKKIMAETRVDDIRTARSTVSNFKQNRYKVELSYKYKVADSKTASSSWSYTPITSRDMLPVIGDLSPLKKERLAKRATVISEKNVNGIRYRTFNGVFTKETWTSLKASSTNFKERYYEAKGPRNLTHHVGVEMEMIMMGCDRFELGNKLTKYNLASSVNITSDGSVSASGVPGAKGDCELRVVDNQYNISSTITKLCEMLADPSIGAGVYNKCGLHIHLDMRKRIAYNAYKNLTTALPILRLLTPSDRRVNKFCKDNKTTDLFKMIELAKTSRNSGEARYWAINPLALTEHNTLEVRMHHGTVDPVVINNWIAILVQIVDAPVVNRNLIGVGDFISTFKFDATMANYIKETIKLYEQATPSVAVSF